MPTAEELQAGAAAAAAAGNDAAAARLSERARLADAAGAEGPPTGPAEAASGAENPARDVSDGSGSSGEDDERGDETDWWQPLDDNHQVDCAWVNEAEYDKYIHGSDGAYRRSFGPSVARWLESYAWCGLGEADEALLGLQFTLQFGRFGECRGTVTSPTNRTGLFGVTWTCSPDHDEEFKGLLSPRGVLGNHFRGKPRPSYVTDDNLPEPGTVALDTDCPLFAAPAGAELANFHLPNDCEQHFPGSEAQRHDRWWATCARLNGPACAAAYAPGMKSYPLALLLTMIIVTKEEMGDDSVAIPIVKTPGKREVFALADTFARRLSAAEARGRCGHGYGELSALEKLTATVAKTAPKGAATDAAWRRAYTHVEALALTLSQQFEEVHRNWQMADDAGRLRSVSASIILAIAAVLLHPPSEASKDHLAADLGHIKRHIQAGTFVESGPECDGFGEEFPEAAQAWERLCALGDATAAAGARGGSDDGGGAAAKRHKGEAKR